MSPRARRRVAVDVAGLPEGWALEAERGAAGIRLHGRYASSCGGSLAIVVDGFQRHGHDGGPVRLRARAADLRARVDARGLREVGEAINACVALLRELEAGAVVVRLPTISRFRRR